MNKKYLLLLALVGGNANADTLSFAKVWELASRNSKTMEASHLDWQATQELKSRTGLHWLPKLYMQAQGYRTNDPGTNFFGLMEQRSVLGSDFLPDTLNKPGYNNFAKLSAGIDMPLFQGGMASAFATIGGASETSAKFLELQSIKDEYSDLAIKYFQLAAVNRDLEKVQELRTNVEKLENNYRVGSKANPVGYSGSLGMKALLEKITGTQAILDAKKISLRAFFNNKGLPTGWEPEPFSKMQKYLQVVAVKNANDNSNQLKAFQQANIIQQQMVTVERAKVLPQVGVFTEGSNFYGKRDNATNYAAGVYLRWNIFEPTQWGAVEEAKLKSLSQEKLFESKLQQESTAKESLQSLVKALTTTTSSMETSEGLLVEQSKITESLFRNGSLNVLQFLEVLNRRLELVMQKTEAEENLVQTQAQLYALGSEE